MGQNSYVLNDNFGIGTSSPISSLHIKQATPTSKITLEDSSTNRVGQIDGGSDGAGGLLTFSVGNNGGTITEYMRINSSGNVGIGTSSPKGRFQASNAFASGETGAQCIFPLSVTIGYAGSDYGTIGYNLDYRNATGNTTGVKYLVSDTISQLDFSSGAFIFRNAASGTMGNTATLTERLRIDSSGNVGIGTTSPSVRLHVDCGSAAQYGRFNSTAANGGYLTIESSGTVHGDIGTAAQLVSGGSASDFGINARGSRNLVLGTNNTERLRIDSSGNVIVSTGSYISTRANNTSDGGGQIYLNGASGNRIDFNTAGVAAPAFTTRSVGTRIVLYPSISASTTDLAFGIESGTLWSSVANAGHQFKWYAGTTNIATLSGAGVLTTTTFSGNLTGNVTGNVSGSSGSCTGNAATSSSCSGNAATATTATTANNGLTYLGATNLSGSSTVLNFGTSGFHYLFLTIRGVTGNWWVGLASEGNSPLIQDSGVSSTSFCTAIIDLVGQSLISGSERTDQATTKNTSWFTTKTHPYGTSSTSITIFIAGSTLSGTAYLWGMKAS